MPKRVAQAVQVAIAGGIGPEHRLVEETCCRGEPDEDSVWALFHQLRDRSGARDLGTKRGGVRFTRLLRHKPRVIESRQMQRAVQLTAPLHFRPLHRRAQGIEIADVHRLIAHVPAQCAQ